MGHVFTLVGTDARAVLESARNLLPVDGAKAVIYFADVRYDAAELSAGFTALFPADAAVFGCSATECLTRSGIHAGQVAVTVLGDDMVEAAAVCLIPGLSAGPDPRPWLRKMGDALGADLVTADPSRYAGLMLDEGNFFGQDRLLDKLGDQSLIQFVGGTASDALTYDRCWVAAGKTVAADAAVLCVLKMKRRFVTTKTQSFHIVGDETYLPGRRPGHPLTFDTLNGRPAAEVYVQAFADVDVAGLEYTEAASRRLFGLKAGGELFAFGSITPRSDGALQMSAAPRQDLPLHKLVWTDMIEDMTGALARIAGELGGAKPEVMLDFVCAWRMMTLRRFGQLDAYVGLYRDIPVMGFSTNGEDFFAHINATSTIFAVGRE